MDPKHKILILQNPRILGPDMASNGAFLDNSSFESFDRLGPNQMALARLVTWVRFVM